MPSTRKSRQRTRPSCAELERLLERRNGKTANHREVDREILRRFRQTRAVFVLDMAGFSLSVQRYGIIHHLAKIHRMREVVRHAVRRHGGEVVKFEADNGFATFPRVKPAIAAAIDARNDFDALNAESEDHNRIHIAVGIGYGPILLGCDDFFGDEVNLASKLGEDIAQSGEILLTASAFKSLRKPRPSFTSMDLVISGVHMRAARLRKPPRV